MGIGIVLAAQVRQESFYQIPRIPLATPNIDMFPSGVGGRLSCYRLKQSLLVFDRPTKEILFGPEWIPGSARLGAPGNTVLAAHRDTHFRFLKDLKLGDRFELQLTGRKLIYQVKKLTIVQKTDTQLLQGKGVNVLTLVTCYPFYYVGNAPKRFIVTASLVESPASNTTIELSASGVNKDAN